MFRLKPAEWRVDCHADHFLHIYNFRPASVKSFGHEIMIRHPDQSYKTRLRMPQSNATAFPTSITCPLLGESVDEATDEVYPDQSRQDMIRELLTMLGVDCDSSDPDLPVSLLVCPLALGIAGKTVTVT